jgi:hypothetical protein
MPQRNKGDVEKRPFVSLPSSFVTSRRGGQEGVRKKLTKVRHAYPAECVPGFVIPAQGRKSIIKTFSLNTFFARSKESIQRKGAQQLDHDIRRDSPRENHKHGVVTNSYPPVGLKHVTPCFRVYELRSATLQRVLKP